jgi:hypothetical protein
LSARGPEEHKAQPALIDLSAEKACQRCLRRFLTQVELLVGMYGPVELGNIGAGQPVRFSRFWTCRHLLAQRLGHGLHQLHLLPRQGHTL